MGEKSALRYMDAYQSMRMAQLIAWYPHARVYISSSTTELDLQPALLAGGATRRPAGPSQAEAISKPALHPHPEDLRTARLGRRDRGIPSTRRASPSRTWR